MKHELEQVITAICKELFPNSDIPVVLTRPEEQFGDYATNIALQLGAQSSQNPRKIADAIAVQLREKVSSRIAHVEIAGPGFINIRLNDQSLWSALKPKANISLEGQIIVTEYSDPNPFKVLHAGHLYTSVVGDAIANLLQSAGAEVHRVNFGGDVGMHVAKAVWAIVQDLGGELPNKLRDIAKDKRSEWMAQCYVRGTTAFEEGIARSEITTLNKRIYLLQEQGDHDSPLAQIYWTCREWSYDYFRAFYDRIGIHFEKYYPESDCTKVGMETVEAQLAKGVFEKSDGAVVFKGEKYGLHTRVFINSEGLPTYETKDVGLIMRKWEDYHFDTSIVITGNEQEQYMAVVLKAIEQFAPKLAHATTHLTHGMVRLAGGEKMSSRKGNILQATDVLDAAARASREAIGNETDHSVLGAVKYAFLKQRLGGDILYDPQESVSLEGNSGPYLQYAYARARSIVAKAAGAKSEVALKEALDSAERSLVRKITEYPEVIEKALHELAPHYICTYLYELAQAFNHFYEHDRVIGSDRETLRVAMVSTYVDVLQAGLQLLAIPAPEHL